MTWSTIAQKVYKICDEPEILKTCEINHYLIETNEIYLNYFDGTCLGKKIKKLLNRPTWKYYSFYHELGHSFFNMFQIGDLNEFWEVFEGTGIEEPDLFKSSMLDDRSDYLTRYSQTDPEEDFADCFAYLMVKNNKMILPPGKNIKNKLNFIRYYINQTIKNYG